MKFKSTREGVAKAFIMRTPHKAGNARTDGETYYLFENPIAKIRENDILFDWCGRFTRSTAAHMNEILRALGIPRSVSYSKAEAGDAPERFLIPN